MLCVICNAQIIADRRRKTCSLECSHELARRYRRRREARKRKLDRILRPEKYRLKDRLRNARKRIIPRGKICQVCGTELPRYKSRYCSAQCNPRSQPKFPRTCRKCNQSIPARRFLCDGCLSASKQAYRQKYNEKRRSEGYSYAKSGQTLEERIRRATRARQIAKKHNRMIKAAYSVWCELQGKSTKPPSSLPLLPPPTCVICGITLTKYRVRILCGSQSCKEARQKEISSCYYYGEQPSATARMIAAADLNLGKFRDRTLNNVQRERKRERELKRNRLQKRGKERWQRYYAAYQAMRELNLLPTKGDEP